MGSRDSGETKVDPHWVQDPPWSFNGPCHGPTIHQTWPFIYWLYFCILCKKNGFKGLWGHKGPPSLGLGPALVLYWTLSWPYNTPDMVLYICAIFLYSMHQKSDQVQVQYIQHCSKLSITCTLAFCSTSYNFIDLKHEKREGLKQN